MEHVRHYLALENIRFDDSIRLVCDLEETAFLLPPLTLQPLVENAVKHGFYDSKKGLTIRLASRQINDRYVITIQDNGRGFDAESFFASLPPAPDRHLTSGTDIAGLSSESSHVGLINVKSRLNSCGGELFVSSRPGDGASIRIELPVIHLESL